MKENVNLAVVDPILEAISRLQAKLAPAVGKESIPAVSAIGRILAEPLVADRDSPALDVSAMDGYALRISDLPQVTLPVKATIPAGSPPLPLPVGCAIQIFTGAPVPPEADCVIKREDTLESPGQVQFRLSADDVREGQNIRRQGENIRKGEVVLPRGSQLTPISMAAVASFAPVEIQVFKRLRISVLNTGDELASPGQAVESWQIRDSNGPTLGALLARLQWCDVIRRSHVADTLASVVSALEVALAESDAVVLTGGVSMGDTDYVPAAIQQLGGEIVFHRLPMRPGRPVLGATYQGKPIIGLPGNPVSVAVTARVIGLPILGSCAGCTTSIGVPGLLSGLVNPDEKNIGLHWFRLVKMGAEGAELVQSKGSGDLASLSQTDGFVHFPPNCHGAGPWPLYLW